MSLTESLELLINADPSKGVAAMQRFATETDKSISKAESSLQRFSSAALKIGGTGVGVGGLLTSLGDKERQAAQGLEASISAAGQSYDEYASKIDKAISHQEQFGHTASETDGALSTLVGSFGDTNKALDQMQLVADLAAKKHISLADAATIVAKAHGGAGRIFKEFNIQVQTNADGTKNYDAALGQLSDKLSGQASASVAGFTGWLKGMGAQVEDTVATFGEKFGPAILGVSGVLTVLGPVASGVSTLIGKLAAAHGAAATTAAAQAAADEGLAVAEAEAVTASEALNAALGPIGLIAAAAGAVFAIGSLIQGNHDVKKSTVDYTQALQDQNGVLAQNIDEVSAHALAQDAAARDAYNAGLSYSSMFDAIRDGGPVLDKFTGALKSSGGDAIVAADYLHRAGAETDTFGKHLLELVTSGALSVDQVTALAEEIASLSDKYRADKTVTDATKDSLGELGGAMDATGGKVETATQKLEDQKKAAEDLGKEYQSLVDGTLSQFQAQIALSNAQIDARKAVDDLNKARHEGKLSDDEGLKLTNDTFDAILREAKANETLAVSMAAGKSDTEKAAVAQQALVSELYQVASTLDPNSDLYQKVTGYITTLQKVPASVPTTFTADTDGAVRAVQEYERQLAGVTGDVEISFIPLTGGGSSNPQKRAMGGPVMGGSSYLIGENGPEVVTFGAPGWVTPNDKLGSSGDTVVQHIYAPVDPYAMAQAAQAERAKARYLSPSGR